MKKFQKVIRVFIVFGVSIVLEVIRLILNINLVLRPDCAKYKRIYE